MKESSSSRSPEKGPTETVAASVSALNDRPVSRRDFFNRSAMVATALGLGARLGRSAPRLKDRGLTRSVATVLYGAAVLDSEVKPNSSIAPLVAAHCRVMVPTGPMHWRYLRPREGVFDFSRADACVAFARQHNLIVRGHTLVWHQMTPSWLAGALSTGSALETLESHIREVVSHFAGSIHSWDVVNEVVWPWDGQPNGLRNSLWYAAAGPSYIDAAFRVARSADRNALLGYNENGIEDDSSRADTKRRAVLSLLERLKNSGVPIDYLGVQSHLAGGQSYEKLGGFLREVRDLGLRVYITEMDVDDRSFPSDFAARDRAVADVYSRYLEAAFAATDIPIVVTWGLTDRSSWLQQYAPRVDGEPQRPLPFDAELRPKPAWDVLRRRFNLV